MKCKKAGNPNNVPEAFTEKRRAVLESVVCLAKGGWLFLLPWWSDLLQESLVYIGILLRVWNLGLKLNRSEWNNDIDLSVGRADVFHSQLQQ